MPLLRLAKDKLVPLGVVLKGPREGLPLVREGVRALAFDVRDIVVLKTAGAAKEVLVLGQPGDRGVDVDLMRSKHS